MSVRAYQWAHSQCAVDVLFCFLLRWFFRLVLFFFLLSFTVDWSFDFDLLLLLVCCVIISIFFIRCRGSRCCCCWFFLPRCAPLILLFWFWDFQFSSCVLHCCFFFRDFGWPNRNTAAVDSYGWIAFLQYRGLNLSISFVLTHQINRVRIYFRFFCILCVFVVFFRILNTHSVLKNGQ